MKLPVLALAMAFMPLAMNGQTISGTISGEDGRGLPGVTVRLLRANDTTVVRGAKTNAKGKFSVKNVAAGDYLPRVQAVGYRPVYGQKLTVKDDVAYDQTLVQLAVQLDNIVVSASRATEKASEAPASVSIVEAKQIAATNAVSTAEHLRGVAGVDITQAGIAQQTVVTRGGSNVFSGLLMMMSDYRNAGVPSLRANISYLMPISDADIDRIEVVRGPGSALYGPNAANGVINIITKSPFASQGTTVELSGGEREYFKAAARHAGTFGDNFGYKISGNYTRGRDWPFADSVEQLNRKGLIAAGAKEDTLRVGKRNFTHERFGVDGRLDYLLGDNGQVTLQTGYSKAISSIEQTDISSGQALNWAYSYVLGRVDYDRLMVQAFVNMSDAGETFFLRNGNSINDRSKQIVGRVQHSTALGDDQEFTYGGDMFLTRPETEGTIMGRNEDKDNINEFGGYVQSKTTLFDKMLDVVLAGRYDYHNRLNDGVFSPRAALVFKPLTDHTFRATFNTGYTAPYPLDLFGDIQYTDNVFGFPAPFTSAVYIRGIPTGGFSFDRDQNGTPLFRSPFAPDKNTGIPVAGAANFWGAATQFVLGGIQADTSLSAEQKALISGLLQAIPAPDPTKVGGGLRMLNTATGSFGGYLTEVKDVSELKPTVTTTFELGYNGIINDMLRVSVDIYSSKMKNFISATQPLTPNAFLKTEDVAAYLFPFAYGALRAQGLDSVTATGIATATVGMIADGYGSIPLGTASIQGTTDGSALTFASRNFGEITYMGADVALELRPDANWTVGGTFSWIDENLFKNVDNIADIPLNAPKIKGSLTVGYADAGNGLTAGARYRHNGGFQMVSGIFNGYVNAYNLVDITVGYDIPGVKGLRAVLTVDNILDFRHREFVGAPDIGRFGSLRASYSF